MLIDKTYDGKGEETLLSVSAVIWDGYVDCADGECTIICGDDARKFSGVKTTIGVILCDPANPLKIQYSGKVTFLADYAARVA